MGVLVSLLVLLGGFALLVKGADAFVDAASALAVRLGMSPLVVGLTVVALGTSAPEVAISLSSAMQAADQMAVANVLGSNIINTLLILGVVALVAEVPVGRTTLRRELPFVLGITALLLGLCLHDGMLGRVDALALLALMGGYLWHVVRTSRKEPVAERNETEVAASSEGHTWSLVTHAVIGAVAIAGGAQLAVSGATSIAQVFGMSERLVGLTIVSLGTSLPELVTSVAAARKGQTEVALGNVVGSSILNVLFVLGLSGAVAPIPFAEALILDGVVALAAAGLLWVVSRRARSRGEGLGRKEGAILLGGYAAYFAHLLCAA